MQAFLNIEKRQFRQKEYVGYGMFKVWHISRCNCGKNKWKAVSCDKDLLFIYGRTLGDISKQLEG